MRAILVLVALVALVGVVIGLLLYSVIDFLGPIGTALAYLVVVSAGVSRARRAVRGLSRSRRSEI